MVYTILDYIWIGGNGELRSKVKVVHDININNLTEVEKWNFDGSSTGQAENDSSEIFLYPVKMVPCPFRKNGSWIVLCSCYLANGMPAKYNHRHRASEIFDMYASQKSWWGLEAEYFIYDRETNLPIGFDKVVYQGDHYCGVGGKNVFNIRQIMDDHMEACLYAGIRISGTNLEVAPGQAEYQIGVVEGLDVADQLWISRFILDKITEKYNAYIVLHPKPLQGDWNGSGMHCNYSTKLMRQKDGMRYVYNAIDKLSQKHSDHMELYGEHNKERMSGKHETSSYNNFSYGIGNRKASIRIPNDAINGINIYIEDRRVASNADPYLVCSKILETTSA